MTNEELIYQLSLFLRNETLEECPIVITSREDIEGEDAELVRFTFGEYDITCVAIAWNDGTVYTPYDWQAGGYDDEDWKIVDCDRWMDCNFRECVMFNGMPRML